ncbi:MAG: hypothetical protein K9N21_04615 [Deltaproteobacteria bacterium]|nr:hypothetical protein [Deltaproteobacteria bacterium]
MKNTLKKAVLICLVLVSMAAAACDKSKWRAKEYGGPPSWEHDMGRPDGYGGEDPWR